MITASFIWLILSHIAVLIPLIIAYKSNNKRRWLACSIVLFLTAFFSSIYHWHENPKGEKGIIFGTEYSTHKSIDFFCSYLSIFSVVFYGINPREKPEHIDIALMIIVIICHILTLVNVEWYMFCLMVTLYCIIYKLFCRRTNWMLTFKNIFKSFPLFFLATLTFVLGMVMQYYYCIIYPSGKEYHYYHGLWHFFMFTSAGLWIKWNNMIRIDRQIPEHPRIENAVDNTDYIVGSYVDP